MEVQAPSFSRIFAVHSLYILCVYHKKYRNFEKIFLTFCDISHIIDIVFRMNTKFWLDGRTSPYISRPLDHRSLFLLFSDFLRSSFFVRTHSIFELCADIFFCFEQSASIKNPMPLPFFRKTHGVIFVTCLESTDVNRGTLSSNGPGESGAKLLGATVSCWHGNFVRCTIGSLIFCRDIRDGV